MWKREERAYKRSGNLVRGIDMNLRHLLLTNALPIIPEEPTCSRPLLVQGHLEAQEFLAAVVGWGRGIS